MAPRSVRIHCGHPPHSLRPSDSVFRCLCLCLCPLPSPFPPSPLSLPLPPSSVSDIPGLVFAAYQGMFAVITPALMTGAFADRLLLGR